jgi:predicted AAA+ superfamily ATPase
VIQRHLTPEIRDALADTPIVLLNGARQVGKSTLAQRLAEEGFGGAETARYLTFDDATVLAAAEADPDGFVRALGGPAVIDEVQRAPGLFRAIKAVVDADRRPGRLLLTGSADVFLLPSVSESLAGRMEVLTLWPFSQGELEGHREGFVDAVFGEALPDAVEGDPGGGDDLWGRVVRGGYPEALARTAAKRRARWYESYVTTILQRDVRDLANVEGLTQMPRLLQLLAARSGSLMNYSEVSRSVGLPNTTLKRYLALLEATYLVRELPAWSANLSKRLVKAPKGLLTDTGLAAELVGAGEGSGPPEVVRGGLIETFVAMELEKQRAWAERRVSLHHFRTSSGQEVDLVLEDSAGVLVGVEVKAAVRVTGSDFKGLRSLQEARPEAFHRGVVLYGGDQVVPFGDRLHAVPAAALWRW